MLWLGVVPIPVLACHDDSERLLKIFTDEIISLEFFVDLHVDDLPQEFLLFIQTFNFVLVTILEREGQQVKLRPLRHDIHDNLA